MSVQSQQVLMVALRSCSSHSSCGRLPSRLLRSIVVTARDQNDARACSGTQLVRADVLSSTPCHCSLAPSPHRPLAYSRQGTRGYRREARTFLRSRWRGVDGARLLESRCGMPRFAGSSLSSAAAPGSARATLAVTCAPSRSHHRHGRDAQTTSHTRLPTPAPHHR